MDFNNSQVIKNNNNYNILGVIPQVGTPTFGGKEVVLDSWLKDKHFEAGPEKEMAKVNKPQQNTTENMAKWSEKKNEQ